MFAAAFSAAVAAADMVFAVVFAVVVRALHVGIICESSFKIIFHRCIRIALNAAEKFDAGFSKRVAGSAAYSAAD